MTTSTTTTVFTVSSATSGVFDKGLLRASIGLTMIVLVGFGFLYSLVGVGLGQAFFPNAANGSLIELNGKIIGSTLVAQPFTSDRYFQPRPSASSYSAMSLAGSNQARTNPEMRKRLDETRAAVAQRDGVAPSAVPSDLVTQSGAGIDPHVSPQGAAIQIDRVARARGMRRAAVVSLVEQHTESRQLGVFGEPRVNVLELNIALDSLPASTPARVPPRTQ